MQILHISKLYSLIGGIENHLYFLSNALSKQSEIDVQVLVCNTKLKTEIQRADRLEVIQAASFGKLLSMPASPVFPLRMWGKHADIVHFHLPFPLGVVSYFLTNPMGKIVVSWHSDIVKQKTILQFYKPLLLRFLRKADRILVASPNYLESSPFLRDFKDKCRISPYGIERNKFELTTVIESKAIDIKRKYGPRILLYVGKLRYYKGIEYLIRAMKGIDARLIIIGEGQLEKDLQELSVNLNVENKITFLPHMDDKELLSFYHACDIFVLPSVERSEAFGIVQLEAMACAKPVVSTNLPTGVPFVNVHNKTGFVVPPRDSDALAEAINILLTHPKLRLEFGEFAQRRVEKEFTNEVVVDRILKIYREIIAQN